MSRLIGALLLLTACGPGATGGSPPASRALVGGTQLDEPCPYVEPAASARRPERALSARPSTWTETLPEPPVFAAIRALSLPDRLGKHPTFYWAPDDCHKWQVVPKHKKHGIIVREAMRDEQYLGKDVLDPPQGARLVRSWHYMLEELDGVPQVHVSSEVIWVFYPDGSHRYRVGYEHTEWPVNPADPETLGVRSWYLTREACERNRPQ